MPNHSCYQSFETSLPPLSLDSCRALWLTELLTGQCLVSAAAVCKNQAFLPTILLDHEGNPLGTDIVTSTHYKRPTMSRGSQGCHTMAARTLPSRPPIPMNDCILERRTQTDQLDACCKAQYTGNYRLLQKVHSTGCPPRCS